MARPRRARSRVAARLVAPAAAPREEIDEPSVVGRDPAPGRAVGPPARTPARAARAGRPGAASSGPSRGGRRGTGCDPRSRRSAAPALHHEGGLPRHVPVRAPGGADGRDRAHPRLVRDHGEADRRRLHARGPRRLDRGDGPDAPRRRRPPGDVVQNAYGYGLFTGGLGFHYGAESVGAAVIPTSGGFTDRQLLALQDLGSTVLCCTPSYALHLAEAIEEAGLRPADLRLRVGFFGAEPWTEAMREAIQARLRLMALNVYGLSEVTGPGVAVECPERRGMHVAEDHFLPEVIDPTTLEPVPPGTIGELVFTTLTKQGMPLHPLPDAGPHEPGSGAVPVRAHPGPPRRGSWGGPTTCSSSGASTCTRHRSSTPCSRCRSSPRTTSSSSVGSTPSTPSRCRWRGSPGRWRRGRAPSPRSPRGCGAGSSRRWACRRTSASWRRRRSSAAPARPSACWTSGRGGVRARAERPGASGQDGTRRPRRHDRRRARCCAELTDPARRLDRGRHAAPWRGCAASGRAAAKPSTSALAPRAGRA